MRRRHPRYCIASETGSISPLLLPKSEDAIAKDMRDWSDELHDRMTAKEAAKKLMGLYYEIADANPEFKDLDEPKNLDDVIHHIHGVVSKFNVDDINFYTGLDWPGRAAYNQKNRASYDAIAKAAKRSGTGWMMSPKTIERAKKELKLK